MGNPLDYDENELNPQDASWNQFLNYMPSEYVVSDIKPFALPKQYRLDVDKIQTLEDIKAVLRAFDIAVQDDVPYFEEVKHLLETQPQ